MYVFVAVVEKDQWYAGGAYSDIKTRLEAASGERCLVAPYQEFDLKVVEDLRPRAIAMSGFGGHWEDRQVAWFLGMDEVLHHADLPIIGFCGSHQLIGFSFNKNLRKVKLLKDEPMRKLGPEEDLPRVATDIHEFYVASGFFPITRVANDPLFHGLPKRMMMNCSHYCEVKQLPPDFELLATSGHCKIEAMRHRSRPIYGTQFHPEAFREPFLHGRVLLENFARIVDRFWQQRGAEKPAHA